MNLKGLGVAMVTPFKPNGDVNFKDLENLTEDLVQDGADFLVVMGTTGEAATLSSKEKSEVLQTVISVNASRIPVIYGIGGNNTKAVCDELENFNPAGVTAILSASPSYNKPTQEGIFQHYKMLGESSPLPIILYNVPGRTASNVEAKTCLRIANEVSAVEAVKEASGDLNQIRQIIEGAPEGFSVFSGDDALTVPVIKAGGAGIISVVGNALAAPFSELTNGALSGSFNEIKLLETKFQTLIPLLFKEGNPAGIKALMELSQKCSDNVRLPLVSASVNLKEELRKASVELLELV